MSQGTIKTASRFDLIFDGEDQQKAAWIVLCKKSSLANIIENNLRVTFDTDVKGNQSIKSPLERISVQGGAGTEKYLGAIFEVLTTHLKENTHLSKDMVTEIVQQITMTGKHQKQFKKAANQNQKNGKDGSYSFSPRTDAQASLWRMTEENTLTFGIGPAGTGKTHVAVARAVAALEKGDVSKILLARPAIGTGKDLGALPGGIEDKLAPFMRPLYDELSEVLSTAKMKEHLTKGTIEIVPVEMMRGRTFKNAFVIVDEAQNCTKEQIRMALTRIGENAKMVVTGDPMQTDLKDKNDSGLEWAYERLGGKDGIGIQYFSPEDVVRHPVVRLIVEALDDDNKANPAQKSIQKNFAKPR